MTLNDLSAQNVTTGGPGLGFAVKSMATGKVWAVSAKLRNGKFVIERNEDGKEAIVDGEADRYELAGNNGRIVELRTLVAELETKIATMQDDLENLESQKFELEGELFDLVEGH